MNRSILIIICDFIITSMIYLNTGLATMTTPFHDAGGSVIDRRTTELVLAELAARQRILLAEQEGLLKSRFAAGGAPTADARLQALNEELATTRAKLEFMGKRMALTRAETGVQSPAALQKELEAEITRKAQIEVRYEQVMAEIKQYQAHLDRAAETLGALKERHADALRELAARNQELNSRGKELELRNQELNATRDNLGTAKTDIARLTERLAGRESELESRGAELTRTRDALGAAQGAIGGYRVKLSTAEESLALLRGRSDAMEKELALSRDRVESVQKAITNREIELSRTKTQLENLQKVLKNAVGDLTGTQNQLKTVSEQRQQSLADLAKLKGEYNTLKNQLDTAEEKLRSDVLKRYSQATLKLKQHLRESRLLMDRDTTDDLFLPTVAIGGKHYLVSALRTLTGSRSNSSAYNDISELNYQLSRPDSVGGVAALKGPLRVEKADCRVALLEVPGNLATPLEIITRDELKTRGIQDLYLFKAGSFGKDSTILNSRCSMSFESDDDYLYIRNGARVSSELKADIGDLILTKQGELAGVVVAQEEFDMGRQLEARCFVFTQLPEVGELAQITLEKRPGDKHYREFADKLNYWLEQAVPLDGRKRRR